MNILDKAGYYFFRMYKFLVAVAVITMPLTNFGDAAQRDNQAERPQKENKETDAKAVQHGAITVEVIMIESKNLTERKPVAGAAVHIAGGEEPRTTNDRGRVRFPGLPTGRLSLQIVVNDINLAPCKISDITVSEAEEFVTVEFDKSQKNNCKRVK